MAMHVALNHLTEYKYNRPIGLGPQVIRLRPAPHSRTRCLSYSLKVEPAGHFLNWQQDPQGNFQARVVFPDKVDHFRVTVDLVADMAVYNPFDFFLEEAAEHYPFRYEPHLAKELEPYLETTEPGPLLKAWLDRVSMERRRTIDFLVDVNSMLQKDIGYVIRMEPGIQAFEETLERKLGSCRDTGWLLCQILRQFGLATRFASGYLIQLKPDVKSLDGPSGAEEDFTDLHAWCEVYLPGAGWVGLDPTSGLFCGEGHIPLACTPKPESAAPITGLVEPAEVEFQFDMSVRRVYETPRVTKPYTDDQWAAIDRMGEEVDRRLTAGDVRLTMGGEPTFVSIDDPDGDEWNTAAVGPTKRYRAAELIKRFKDRFAPNGLLHFGQGKWYPGESLPRWAFALYWRSDGLPLWRDPALTSNEPPPPTGGKEPPPAVRIADAERLMQAVAEALEIDQGCVIPAYEDPLTYMAMERQLPANVDVFDSKLENEEERTRLAKVFERGLSTPVGFALPLQRWQSRDRRRGWRSERWALRRKRLFLVPGDSPVGYRLPLGALPYVPPSRYPWYIPEDPFAERAPLPVPDDRHQHSVPGAVPPQPEPTRQPMMGTGGGSGSSDIGGYIRTALSIEDRDGRLCAFMPPTWSAEDYADLVGAIEGAASRLKLPVTIEGYPPPDDPRLNVIKVTPDPGVIEVNVQPAHSWRQAKEITEGLYEDAHFSRLDTQKFMLDGRHTGTGGGNHVVVGGATAADSPFLRRPDLLRSLINYWQNHPSLSYLFSGMFLGPTSQAPRVDEARNDSLYELEIAFKQVPDPDTYFNCPPWLVDRIFRNLLIDVTGNTHRAEICIDKLYSPDGPTGRLGLVEFRAFEMPPHPRMSLVQQLLLRALIARFWETPYKQPLVRWQTSLHDRFMLPTFVWQDFRDVLRDMRDAGWDLQEEWFLPFFEFRFPLYGTVAWNGITLEVRQALEPWHVLGEEGAIGGTARYVDSSLERVEIKATGLAGDRYAVSCNGWQVPLQPTGIRGEGAAGVRYRAWQPPSALHPTIPVHAPLVFNLYDRWNGRAVAGCTYNVSHPGGLAYESFPVNSYEAESRRLSRFQDFGHMPGRQPPPPPLPNPDFPGTLDLRLA